MGCFGAGRCCSQWCGCRLVWEALSFVGIGQAETVSGAVLYLFGMHTFPGKGSFCNGCMV